MVRLVLFGMVPLLVDAKVDTVPETHETDVELVLRQ